jgi:hypothetical protein
MTSDLQKLIDKARFVTMSEAELEEQRRSFAFGSAKIENDDITRDLINQAAIKMRDGPNDGR